jgi:hypothetical protein
MKRSIGIVSVVGLSVMAGLFFIYSFGANQGNFNDAKNAASAPFRDGTYQARLAAARGDEPHVSAGRWSNDADRQAYVAGYEQAFHQARERSEQEGFVVSNSDEETGESIAAFRDGVYQARLAAENGVKPHLSTGRWSKAADRRAYVAGYQQEYLEARGEDGITIPQGIEQAGYRDGLEDGAQDRRSGDASRPSQHARVAGNDAYREAYATGYQLAYYGEQQVQNALVIRPVAAR